MMEICVIKSAVPKASCHFCHDIAHPSYHIEINNAWQNDKNLRNTKQVGTVHWAPKKAHKYKVHFLCFDSSNVHITEELNLVCLFLIYSIHLFTVLYKTDLFCILYILIFCFFQTFHHSSVFSSQFFVAVFSFFLLIFSLFSLSFF